MEPKRKKELSEIIGTLEMRFKHYEGVSERRDQHEMSRAFNSAVNDFEYALQTLRAVRDDRAFDQDDDE
ncbi:MAG: hypothetical protein ACKV2V_06635 [Blastocatellia bacterium]